MATAVSAMNLLGHPHTAVDHVQSALEASCAALITLTSARAGTTEIAGSISGAEDQLRRIIDLLREAASDLQPGHDHYSAVPGFGFVMASSGELARD